jgi:predicted NACHT family NTPase
LVAKGVLRPAYAYRYSAGAQSDKVELMSRRCWIEERVTLFNSSPPNEAELRKFLESCQKIFNIVGKLLIDRRVAESVGLNSSAAIKMEVAKWRLKLPIHDVLQTGLNIVVLGDAGAGKTTSLQMYALRNIADEGSLTVYTPLGRVVRVWSQANGRWQSTLDVPPLQEAIALFLSSLGTSLSGEELIGQLSSRRSAVLLDGIDEATKVAPWIVESIIRFAEKFIDVQVVASSRAASEYVESMPFIAISLLPFTPSQQKNFIERWFERNDYHVSRIEQHLVRNPVVAEVSRTPLLATILCVLQENEVPLPDSQLRLYEERMRLLLGDYDVYKKTTRLSSKRYYLEKISRKLAFYLHMAGKREEDKELLYVVAEKVANRELDREHARLAVDELLDPCSILVPMTEDGKIGFGHLVYQEYLVAKDLMNNPMKIPSLLSNPWWRGSLVLFSRMADEIKWLLLRPFVIRVNLRKARETIFEMISVRPPEEGLLLRDLFEEAIEADIKKKTYEDDWGPT